MKITLDDFVRAVGRVPIEDELDRCNCSEVGYKGHLLCGWCNKHKKPRFMCGCLDNTVTSSLWGVWQIQRTRGFLFKQSCTIQGVGGPKHFDIFVGRYTLDTHAFFRDVLLIESSPSATVISINRDKAYIVIYPLLPYELNVRIMKAIMSKFERTQLVSDTLNSMCLYVIDEIMCWGRKGLPFKKE